MKPIIWLALCGALASTPASAELYRWVDEHGKVHFSDKPTGDADAETVDIKAPPRIGQDESVQQINERVKRLHETESEQRSLEERRVAAEKAEKEQIEKRCARARVELRKYQGPVYKLDDNGARIYLTDEEHSADKARISEWIEKNCKES